MLTVADTAYSIAQVRAEEGERPEAERLFVDPYAHVFAAAGDHAREGTDRYLNLPFFRDGIRLRTRFIDDFVREGLAGGIDRIVVMGAGFDARSLRMPEIAAAHASVFEVDFEDQLARKRALLEAAQVVLPKHVSFLPCDFTDAAFGQTLEKALVGAGCQTGSPMLFIWEGVVSYLEHPAIARSLDWMARSEAQEAVWCSTSDRSSSSPTARLHASRRTVSVDAPSGATTSCGDGTSPVSRTPARRFAESPSPRFEPATARLHVAPPRSDDQRPAGGPWRAVRARSKLKAALINARWVKAWGKLPSASPLGPVSSE